MYTVLYATLPRFERLCKDSVVEWRWGVYPSVARSVFGQRLQCGKAFLEDQRNGKDVALFPSLRCNRVRIKVP